MILKVVMILILTAWISFTFPLLGIITRPVMLACIAILFLRGLFVICRFVVRVFAKS